MSKFIVFIKNTWRDSESQIQWILYYSIRPHGRRFERQWSDTIDDEGHMTKPTWEMQHVRISFIPHNLVRTGEAGPQSTKFIAKENGRLKKIDPICSTVYWGSQLILWPLCVWKESLFFQFCLVPPMRQKGHTSLVKLLHLLSFFILKKYSTAIQFVRFEIIDIFFKMKTKSSLVRLVIQC